MGGADYKESRQALCMLLAVGLHLICSPNIGQVGIPVNILLSEKFLVIYNSIFS